MFSKAPFTGQSRVTSRPNFRSKSSRPSSTRSLGITAAVKPPARLADRHADKAKQRVQDAKQQEAAGAAAKVNKGKKKAASASPRAKREKLEQKRLLQQQAVRLAVQHEQPCTSVSSAQA